MSQTKKRGTGDSEDSPTVMIDKRDGGRRRPSNVDIGGKVLSLHGGQQKSKKTLKAVGPNFKNFH